MAAYENNPTANATAFIDGWFRTGDVGTMDDDGYLSIVGRLKEIINRGGEKISPREVDEIIMEHPAVHQCVTFAVPHDMLGEEVGAAIVLREGHTADEKELRAFAAVKLADFKVPRKIVIVKEIPGGGDGKAAADWVGGEARAWIANRGSDGGNDLKLNRGFSESTRR